MKEKLYNITKYFGFLTVAIEWVFFIILLLINNPDANEPFSQYGYFNSTHLYFAVGLTLPAITYYLFSLHLNKYWSRTSLFAAIAGVMLIVTGWVPYRPHVNTFILDIHNASVVISVIFYSLPMIFIGYKKSHREIATASTIMFWTVSIISGASIACRFIGQPMLYLQILSLILFQTWAVVVNYLLLEHDKGLKSNQNQLL